MPEGNRQQWAGLDGILRLRLPDRHCFDGDILVSVCGADGAAHERKMKMMKRKLARNEERLKKLRRQDREGCIEKAENSRDGASPNNNV
jgi:hypothetical protein